ncbi:NAD(P)/FAD-dependent oxidoreductase [Rhizobium brockwellii]
MCTAIFLANRDVQVTLLEKGRIAAEESSRNWGWIRKQGRDADELPIVIEACRLWQQLADECLEDIGLRQTGVTYVARTAKDMAAFEDFMNRRCPRSRHAPCRRQRCVIRGLRYESEVQRGNDYPGGHARLR